MAVEHRRVVVTGLGMASAIGVDEETMWSNLLAGRGGIETLVQADLSLAMARLAATRGSALLSTPAICADEEVKSREAELLRGISDMLNCPMPPLLPGQQIKK